MVQSIKSKTHAHAKKSGATAASKKRTVSKTGSSKKAAKNSSSTSHSKSYANRITKEFGKIARDHNLEEAIKSAMKALIDKIKF